jgi:hypothetical protein
VHALEVVRRRPGNDLARLDVARQGDEPYVGVLDKCFAGGNAVAGDHVKDARRDDVLDQLHEAKQRQRGLLGRLQHLDVPGCKRRGEFPDRHHERVVPGRDPGHDPQRLAADHRGVAAHVLAGRASLEDPGRAGEEADVVGTGRHLVARVRERLTDVARLERGQLVGVLVDHVCELEQELRALCGRRLQPFGQRRLGGLDRTARVLRGAPRDLGDHLARRRVDDLHRLAAGGVDPFPADEVLVLAHCDAHLDLRVCTARPE